MIGRILNQESNTVLLVCKDEEIKQIVDFTGRVELFDNEWYSLGEEDGGWNVDSFTEYFLGEVL